MRTSVSPGYVRFGTGVPPCQDSKCLGLAASSLSPLLRALKLQASLTELRISGNRMSDDLLPELIATTLTMPRLQLLDISANCITGDGLEKAVNALKGQSAPAFPVRASASQ